MSARKPSGFTLVELLVVIVIISLLIGLLIPAVVMSREAARKNTCTNNQHEIAVALQQYESASDKLPSFVNTFGSTTNLTWVAMITPHLGLNDLWKVLRSGGTPDSGATAGQLTYHSDPRLLCPSDSEKKSGDLYCALSYVGNCGWVDASNLVNPLPTQQGPQRGLFTGAVKTTDAIPDGASNTILFSENVNAIQWYTTTQMTNVPTGATRPACFVDAGMFWCKQNASGSLGDFAINANLRSATLPSAAQECSDIGTNANNVTNYWRYARPSSYHSGGVVVTYADGHSDFVANEIDPAVYQSKMSPNDAAAKAASPALMP